MSWPQQQQQQNGVFPGMLDPSNQQNLFDPSMNQMYNGAGINPSQFNNPHMQQRMPNGGIHPQNAFPNQTYNVGQVIPSKRGSDGMAMSPGPPQNNTINTSRSQTPMQSGTPFSGGQPGQQFPNPYQHLQQGGSANASPSPTIQNQQFRQPQPPQRMTSQSPANFNQMPHSAPGQMSPAPGQPQHNMSMSPQAQQQNFSPNLAGGAGFGHPFSNPGMMQQGMPGGMNNMNPAGMNMTAQQQALLQQRQYQQRILQQQQRMQANAMTGQRQMPGQMGTPMAGQMGGQMGQQFNADMQPGQGMANGQQPNQPQQPSQQQGSNQQEKARNWLMGLQQSLQSQGKPFNANPQIGNKQVSLYLIWACILGLGGSARITAGNAWPSVLAKLGLPANDPNAVQQLKQTFDMYLSAYERQLIAQRQAQRQQQAQMNARQMAGLGGPQQASPTRPPQTPQDGQQNQFMQPQQPGQQMNMSTPVPQQQTPNPMQRPGSMQMQNGMPVPGMPGAVPQQMDPTQHKRQPSVVKQDSVPPQAQAEASPVPGAKASSKAIKRENSIAEPPKQQETEYIVTKRVMEDTYGGYSLESVKYRAADIASMAQDSIRAQTMFIADMRALTLSLQSGIPSEVRYAIDTLNDLSSKPVYWKDARTQQPIPGVILLDKCEDLLDAILDCLEEHLDQLAEDAPEVTDDVELHSYEEVLRQTRIEQESLRDIPDPGTTAWTMEHIADRVVALIQILSNLSMDQYNHGQLTSKETISLLSNAIRMIGTRQLYLRTQENTIDFYKIVITFLSNIAGPKLELPTRDDALHVLHFLLAFAPQPPPLIPADNKPIHFTSYTPSLHRYAPAAVDTLAKLLARQEPNRTFYRTIFTSHSSSETGIAPHDLFTRAFGLSVCFLPDRNKGPLLIEAELNLLKLRKAYLGQGMLAADILASLIAAPSSSSQNSSSANGAPSTNGAASYPSGGFNIAKKWLESSSNWPASLLRVALLLATNPRVNENLLPLQERPVRRDHAGNVVRDRTHQVLFSEDNDVPGITAQRGLGMLLKLVERAGLEKERERERGGKSEVNGAEKDGVDGQGVDGEVMEGKRETENEEESDAESVVFIKGDPLPKRQTVTALLGAAHPVDAEALRLMDRLYDLIMPRA
ncbi:putative SWI/SNF chromatin-remodeling complex subunit sol1 [Elsinoe australis]|uniref:Putative SWI/SNF chromatin-remodeling complex subunit sol1 n=1 Tax=Elsinoe australis TaxID=40998 RepID=A0A4U7B9W9_9PEZI|nr:putative SWI/SNF chromatin-remodeling complex subunit sol1 [Elsinoe australis]